ncbi:hypothetical protein IGI04_012841 [Brassica rapa subsp. trilocularis]|uniref:Sm domain-containing protein n=1 Tax=Brassica rapa subsp. trilocularis TaxID=1813537 RepID=A0ABQ7N733_BRACM|nr:hypothetical protein IGI04_012841 [Brassica rapa subsp. trilocularis]
MDLRPTSLTPAPLTDKTVSRALGSEAQKITTTNEQASSSSIYTRNKNLLWKMEQEEAERSTTIVASTSEESSGLDAIARVRKLLFRQMLVGIKDGRFFLGSFHCIDKQGNILLQDAVEYRSIRRSSPSPTEQRCLGMILIPASCRTSCHVDCSVEEQLSLIQLKE